MLRDLAVLDRTVACQRADDPDREHRQPDEQREPKRARGDRAANPFQEREAWSKGLIDSCEGSRPTIHAAQAL